MALYISHSIFHLARLFYVRPETFGPYHVPVSAGRGFKSEILHEELSQQFETSEQSPYMLEDRGIITKTCVEMGGHSIFRMQSSSQQFVKQKLYTS